LRRLRWKRTFRHLSSAAAKRSDECKLTALADFPAEYDEDRCDPTSCTDMKATPPHRNPFA
jgi:hypothetical protein